MIASLGKTDRPIYATRERELGSVPRAYHSTPELHSILVFGAQLSARLDE
jgi:hypothetical protein